MGLQVMRRMSTSTTRRAATSSPTSFKIPAVVGTAPVTKRHLILHTNHAASTWPSHLESVSELYRDLGKRKKLEGLGYNVSDAAMGKSGTEMAWDPTRARFEEPPSGQSEE